MVLTAAAFAWLMARDALLDQIRRRSGRHFFTLHCMHGLPVRPRSESVIAWSGTAAK